MVCQLLTLCCPSYGSLGFLTRVTLRLVQHRPYISLTYRPCYS